MSLIVLNKFSGATQPAPASGKAGLFYDSDKNTWCYIDEFGAKWYFGEQRVALASDLSGNNTTTLQDMTGMVFPLRASTMYKFEFRIMFQTAATTTGIKLGLTAPGSLGTFAAHVDIPSGAAATTVGDITASGGSVSSTTVAAASTVYEAMIRGTIKTGGTAGNLQVQWASSVGGSNATPKAGSSGRLWFP